MDNNEVLRQVCDIFTISDMKMVAILGLADLQMAREQVGCWLKKADDPDFQLCPDAGILSFLDGFIIDRRGKKEGVSTQPEQPLTNNAVFRKLKIALDLKAEDVLAVLRLGNVIISKHELSAFFRKPDHKHYRECKDQLLRDFLIGVSRKYRVTSDG